jgi:hypothetical protein
MRRISMLAVVIALSVASALPSGAATGRHWTEVLMKPSPVGRVAFDVSCPTATFCVATGATRKDLPFAMSWDGSGWIQMTLPTISGTHVALGGVSCVSSTFCFIVGSADGANVALLWNGADWSAVATPPASAVGLGDVSCTSTTNCVAISDQMFEYWDGLTWQLSTDIAPGFMSSVSCATRTSCMAVGTLGNSELFAIQGGPKHFTTVSNPPLVGDVDFVTRVSCASVHWCVAVGSASQDDLLRPAEYAWHDGTWTTNVDAPVAGYQASLDGVSCVTARACVASGAGAQDGPDGRAHFQTIESWNGTSWRQDHVHKINGAGLGGVSCASADACVIVGARQRRGIVFVPLSYTNEAVS